MRLLFAIKTMHFAAGGAERVLATLCNGLAARGHDVTLVSFDPGGVQPVYRLADAVDWIRLEIGDAGARSGFGETCRRIGGLRRVLAKQDPHTAVGFMHSSCIPLAIAALGSGIPLVFSEHIVPQYYRDRRFEYFLFQICGSLAARITVISEDFIPLYPRFLASRMRAVPNPLTLLSRKKAAVLGEQGAPKVLLSVGRLVAQKDHETLLRAFAAIAPDHPEWALRIVGAGPLRAELESLARSLGIGERVTMVGTVADIAAEYLGAQLYCVPSRYEGLPLAPAEALSLGLPVVGFADCPGTDELIEDGINGILVPAGDRVGNLSRALGELMGDGGWRARLAAEGPKVTDRYSPESFVSRWETLLSALAPKPQ